MINTGDRWAFKEREVTEMSWEEYFKGSSQRRDEEKKVSQEKRMQESERRQNEIYRAAPELVREATKIIEAYVRVNKGSDTRWVPRPEVSFSPAIRWSLPGGYLGVTVALLFEDTPYGGLKPIGFGIVDGAKDDYDMHRHISQAGGIRRAVEVMRANIEYKKWHGGGLRAQPGNGYFTEDCTAQGLAVLLENLPTWYLSRSS